MLPIGRMLDTTFGICTAHEDPIAVGGVIISSQSTVFVNGLPAGRGFDIILSNCGHTGIIMNGSSKVFITGLPSVRMGDPFVGSYSGNITGGSGNVFSS